MKECKLPALTKESSPEVIENYFRYVLELAQSGDPFPSYIEDVWQLVYSRKDLAVRALRQDFMQDIDYQIFRRNEENCNGVGRPSEDCNLSVPCLEFFVARKSREVFNIYRKVFHATYQMAQQAVQKSNPAPQPKPKAENKPIRPVSVAMLRSEYANIALMRDTCNLSPADVADMANKISEKHGLTARVKYVPANGVLRCATELLQKYRDGFSTQTFNKLMIQHGYLKEEDRPTSKGGTKTFKMLTDKATPYGENKRSPHNSREMQPLYYDHMFCELCNLVGVPNTPQDNLLPLDFDNTAV